LPQIHLDGKYRETDIFGISSPFSLQAINITEEHIVPDIDLVP
jgi:hypothetical protein